MKSSPIRTNEIKAVLKEAFTDKINDYNIHMKSIAASCSYAGYGTYSMVTPP